MTVKKTLGAYADCAQVMDIAFQRGEIRVPFSTRGQAINFRQRCYRLRQELLKADNPPPGRLPSSKYDSIVITVPDKGNVGDDILTFRSREKDANSVISRITDAEGNLIELKAPDLEEAAKRFRSELGLE